MSTRDGVGVEDGVREMLLLMPRLVGRAKRIRVPAALASFTLAPRHLTLLSLLLLDGPMPVNELAKRLEVAPATVSLMVGDLSRQGILDRREDEHDRRRTIVSIAADHRPAIDDWLAVGARAGRHALSPLSPAERRTFLDTLRRYEERVEGTLSKE